MSVTGIVLGCDGNTTVVIPNEVSFGKLRTALMDKNPGYAILSDSKMQFPAKYFIAFHNKLKGITFEKIEREFDLTGVE
jgi:hypothetical protein